MKKLIAQQNQKKDRLSGIFMTVLIVMVVSLCVTRVIIANRLIEASEKLRTMDKTIEQIKTTNQTLAQELRAPQSITQIKDKAKALGFTKTNKIVFLAPTPEVAMQTNIDQTLR